MAPRTHDERAARARAAEALIASGSVDARAIAAHLDAAGLARDAAPWHAELARRAWQEERADETLAHVDAALSGGLDDDEEEAAMHLLRVEVFDARGAIEESLTSARDAMAAAPVASALWFRAAAAVVVSAMRRGETDHLRAAAAAVEAALRYPVEAAAVAGLAPAVLPLLRAGHYALADLVILRMQEVPAADAPPDLPARLAAARALRANFRGDPLTFLRESEAAAAAYARVSEHRLALLHRANAGFARVTLGDGEGAARILGAVRRDALALGFARTATVALHNLGPARLLLGDVAGARRAEEDALEEAAAQGDTQIAAMCRLYLARVELAAGRNEDVVAHADAGLAGLARNPGAQVLGRALRARALIALGRLAAARDDVAAGFGTLAVLGSVEEGDAELHLAAAELADAAGEPDAARAWAQAAERVRTRAARITDDAARERFLRAIAEHAAVTARG